MQHPTLRHSKHEMFDSLKRWMGLPERLEDAIPLEITHTGPLRPSETGRPIPYIDQVALDFPSSASSAGTSGIRGRPR